MSLFSGIQTGWPKGWGYVDFGEAVVAEESLEKGYANASLDELQAGENFPVADNPPNRAPRQGGHRGAFSRFPVMRNNLSEPFKHSPFALFPFMPKKLCAKIQKAPTDRIFCRNANSAQTRPLVPDTDQNRVDLRALQIDLPRWTVAEFSA